MAGRVAFVTNAFLIRVASTARAPIPGSAVATRAGEAFSATKVKGQGDDWTKVLTEKKLYILSTSHTSVENEIING